jgi:hypothetical protein
MFRKLIVIAVCAIVLTMASLPTIVAALDRAGAVPLARAIRSEYLTGTAITVIVALLILIPSAGYMRLESRPARCPVCDQQLRQRSRYCPACGSRVAT